MQTWATRCATVLVAAGLLGAGLAGCSSDGGTSSAGASSSTATSSASDVCASADSLRSSLAALGDVQVVAEGTDGLTKAWTTVEDKWSQFADDARGTYSSQVDSVQADADAVSSAADTARSDSSPQTLGALAAAVGTFLKNAGALVDEVRKTC